jgi:hypothetical protein
MRRVTMSGKRHIYVALADRATRKGKQRLLEQAIEHERAAAGAEIVSDEE